jgi:hypothetical protein
MEAVAGHICHRLSMTKSAARQSVALDSSLPEFADFPERDGGVNCAQCFCGSARLPRHGVFVAPRAAARPQVTIGMAAYVNPMSAMYAPNDIFIGPPNSIRGASIVTQIANQTKPSKSPSRTDALFDRFKYAKPRTTAVAVTVTAIMDSKRGRADSRNGKAANATTNGINQARTPKPKALRQKFIGSSGLLALIITFL